MTNSGGAAVGSFGSETSGVRRWRAWVRAPVATGGLMLWFLLGLLAGSAAAQADMPEAAWIEYERNTIEVVQAVGASVVSVRIANGDPPLEGPAPNGERFQGGSGFVVDEEGRIITNFHVVAMVLADASDESLELAPGASLHVSYLSAPDQEHAVRVLGANPDFDFALLEVVNPPPGAHPSPIPLADSDQVQVGQKAIAIGNPFGLQSTVTAGIISAVERERPGLVGIEIPYVQTDAAINPGNSGGPLLNSAGEVIGINNAILAPTGAFAGIGLAVPSNLLRDSMEELRAGGLSGMAAAAAQLPDRPRLGLEIARQVDDYPNTLRQRLELPERGVVVTAVAEGGPADRAGIRGPEGVILIQNEPFPFGMDVITGIDGQPVRQPLDIQRVILERDEGDVVTLTVWRDGAELEVEIALEVVPVE